MILLLISAMAQGAPGSPSYSPEAGSFAPLRDGSAAPGPGWTHALAEDTLFTSANLSWQHRPLVFTLESGETRNVLGDVAALRMAASHRVGPVRLGLNMPLYLVTTSDYSAVQGPVLGDVDLWGSAYQPAGSWRIGGSLHATGPLGGAARQVGALSPGFEAWGLARHDGPTSVQIELGIDLSGEADLADVRLDDRAQFVAAAWRPVGPLQASVELAGSAGLHSLSDTTAHTLEMGGHVWRESEDGRWVRAGLSTGLTHGIGVPQTRAELSVGLRRI